MKILPVFVALISFVFVANVAGTHAPPNQTAQITHTHHNDHLGTPQRLTDKAGNLLWSAQYDAYGKAQVQTTASAQLATTNPLRQPGQYLDLETGLHYNDRRYYDADTGRYQTRDPIGFEGGINLYSYAAASPSRFTDPTGEIIPCLAMNFARCMVLCGLQSAAMNAASGECIDIGNIAKDCAVDCLLSMLPIPDPCGRFGKLFSAAIGIGAGLDRNSFEQDTLVHTRVMTDSGYQTKLKAIKDIQVGDEVLAWDELQAHDNAAMVQSGQAAQTLQAAHNQADSQNTANSSIKSASSAIKSGASSYQNKSIKSAQRYEKVTDTISSLKEQTLLHITLSNGQTIQATAGHPFKTLEGWRDAVLLKRGGQLLLGGEADADAPERFATITDIRQEVKTTAVYNLEVANLHTFFVGVDGVVVHNGVVSNRAGGKQFEKDVAAGFNKNSTNGSKASVGGEGVNTPFGWRFPDITIKDDAGEIAGYLECKKGKSRYNSSQRVKDEWIRNELKRSTVVVRGL